MRHFHLTTIILVFCYFSLSAQVRLDVAGEARVTGDYIELIKPDNTAHHLRLSSSGAAMDINATTDLYLNSGGNLNLDANNPTGRIGVGTAAPAVKFHVVGDAIRLSTPGNDNRYLSLRTDGGALDLSPVGAPLYIDPGAFNLILATQSGHVGIGTETPAQKLSVVGDALVQGRLELFRSAGDSSLFIGLDAGLNDDGTDNDNTFIGTKAGQTTVDGYLNTFLGSKAGMTNTTGFSNTFLGGLSGFFNVNGVDNAFVGALAGFNNQSGSLNTFMGTVAGFTNVNGTRNTFVGKGAGYTNDFGNNNTFLGMDAGFSNTTGPDNTFVGQGAGFANTTGQANVALGKDALRQNAERSNLVAVGDSALYHNGEGAIASFHATYNTAIGSKALYSNTRGYYNTATGRSALFSNTTGFDNTANGRRALYSNTTGVSNTATGRRALYSNINGSANTATGWLALFSNTTGDSNTATGRRALFSNTTGDSNTATGRCALEVNVDGNYNTALGYEADVSVSNLQYSTALGAEAVTNANEKTVIGRNSAGVVIGGYAAWSNLSDGRFKEGVKENVPGLEFIRELRPVTYWVNIGKLQKHITAQMPDTIAARYLPEKDDLAKAKQEIRTGFVAQEVEAVAKRIGYDFDGVNAPKNPTDNYSIAYSQFVPSLVKATQEQQEEIEALEEEISGWKLQVANLADKNDRQGERIDELESLVRQLLAQNQDEETINSQTIQLRTEAQLDQNRPNPFGEQTVITYYIPEGTTKAQLRISAPDGKVLRVVDISGRGPGQTIVQTRSLPAGAYAYTLILDGRASDTRQMVIR